VPEALHGPVALVSWSSLTHQEGIAKQGILGDKADGLIYFQRLRSTMRPFLSSTVPFASAMPQIILGEALDVLITKRGGTTCHDLRTAWREEEAELKACAKQLDFRGFNHYNRQAVALFEGGGWPIVVSAVPPLGDNHASGVWVVRKTSNICDITFCCGNRLLTLRYCLECLIAMDFGRMSYSWWHCLFPRCNTKPVQPTARLASADHRWFGLWFADLRAKLYCTRQLQFST